jgi:hypothetical protein
MKMILKVFFLWYTRIWLIVGWSTDSEVRRIPMPRDTPPATKKPKPQMQAVVTREVTPPPTRTRPKPVEKVPEPVVVKEGPSDSVEEAFLRAGATVIEAAPVLRDFQKEAVSFVPSIVKRRPPQKKAKKVEDTAKVGAKDSVTDGGVETSEVVTKVEKSFVTTVEDGEEDESMGERQSPPAVQNTTTSVPGVAKPAIPETLKRPLEQDKKPTETPPVTAPKRRRMVNAAPDV